MPFWIAPVFGLLAAVTVPWTAYLAVVLPGHADAPNYRSAWVGFDIGLVLALSATAYLAWRGRRQVALAATATATLLVVDAWFDGRAGIERTGRVDRSRVRRATVRQARGVSSRVRRPARLRPAASPGAA